MSNCSADGKNCSVSDYVGPSNWYGLSVYVKLGEGVGGMISMWDTHMVLGVLLSGPVSYYLNDVEIWWPPFQMECRVGSLTKIAKYSVTMRCGSGEAVFF